MDADATKLKQYARAMLPLTGDSMPGLNGAFVLYDDEAKEVLTVSVWEDAQSMEVAGLARSVLHDDAVQLGLSHVETRSYDVLNGMGLQF